MNDVQVYYGSGQGLFSCVFIGYGYVHVSTHSNVMTK